MSLVSLSNPAFAGSGKLVYKDKTATNREMSIPLYMVK